MYAYTSCIQNLISYHNLCIIHSRTLYTLVQRAICNLDSFPLSPVKLFFVDSFFVSIMRRSKSRCGEKKVT